MKVVSFNIRCDYSQDKENSFSYRKEKILKKINDEKPDIIGFQEVLPHVQEWLRNNLNEYMVVGCGRDEDLKDEYMTLALRRDTIELYGLDIFWLSTTPRIRASRYEEQSICPRTCAVATIKAKGIETPIRVYNTHLDHEGMLARKLGLQQILIRMAEDRTIEKYPVILMGDFNAEPDSEELSELKTSKVPLVDTAKDLGITYHEYGNEKAFVKIDYLLISDELGYEKSYLWKDCENGVYLSDHYPVCAEVDLVVRRSRSS